MESSLLDKTRAHLKSERIEYSQMNNHNCSSICDTKKFFHHFVGSTSFKKDRTQEQTGGRDVQGRVWSLIANFSGLYLGIWVYS